MSSPAPQNRLLGKVLAQRYRLDAVLGQGGFANVFRAHDISLEHDVALKLMSPHLMDSAARESFMTRFEREAKMVASFQHAHIVRVFDTGYFEEEGYVRPFIVMELLRGKDLDQVLASERRLPPMRARGIILQALDALAYVHAMGVVHRDLKPANLFLTPSTGLRGVEHLFIMDFGIALHEQFADERLTGTRDTIGTMHYLPPEYLESGLITPAMDTYQLGLILCELITGEPMVRGSGLQAAFQVQRMGVKVPEVFAGCAALPFFEKAIARDPAQRFEDASSMYTALEALRAQDFPQALDAEVLLTPLEPMDEQKTSVMGMSARAGGAHTTSRQDSARRAASLKVGLLLAALILCAGAVAIALTAWSRAPAPPAEVGPAVLIAPPHAPERHDMREDMREDARMDLGHGLPDASAAQVAAVWRWRVQSEPAGADVLVDGELVGSAPVTLSFERARIERVTISLKLEGYRPEHIKALTDSDRTIALALEPIKKVRKPRVTPTPPTSKNTTPRTPQPQETSPPAALPKIPPPPR